MKSKKKAFTLTELLVVVIVIGILSAVVLPKFNKVVETRKTTEAEEVMAAIRTEQEKRCALNKKYINDFTKLEEILPSVSTNNYTYSFTQDQRGIAATSKGSYNYTLKMPSYTDGRICCDTQAAGNQCDRLNKDYPSCSELIARADYTITAQDCNPPLACSGESTQACGCNNSGTQTRTCDSTTGTWSAWSACTGTHCDCPNEGYGTTRYCNCNGTQTRTCNTSTGTWNGWGTCNGYTEPGKRSTNYTPAGKSPKNCASAEEVQGCDESRHTWSWAFATMSANPDESACCSGTAGARMVNFTPPGAEPINCGSQEQEQECVGGQWLWITISEDTSECKRVRYEWDENNRECVNFNDPCPTQCTEVPLPAQCTAEGQTFIMATMAPNSCTLGGSHRYAHCWKFKYTCKKVIEDY